MITVRENNKLTEMVERKGCRMASFGEQGFWKPLKYSGILEGHTHAQSGMHAQARCERL